MNKKYILGGFLLAFSSFLIAQDADNLVPNPSFEGTKGKLKNIKQIDKATDWYSPTSLKADLFSASVSGAPISVPDNVYGTEKPLTGDNYAGITAFSYNNKQPRTYLITTLTQKLQKGQKYCVKFNVSLADLSKYAINNLGAHLTTKPIELEGKKDLIFTEKDKEIVLKIGSNRVFNARYNFETVCSIYEAQGKEQYLIIGNFTESRDTKFEKLKKDNNLKGSQVPIAYYYIDDVSVSLITEENENKCTCEIADVEEVERVIYRKQSTSMDGFTDEEIVKNATIYFDHLKSEVEPDSKVDLDNLATILIDHPNYKLTLIGHSTNEEVEAAKKEEFHSDLAKRRLNKTIEYLKSHGLDDSRFETEIMDNIEPASTGDTPLDDAKNRRVEFKLKG